MPSYDAMISVRFKTMTQAYLDFWSASVHTPYSAQSAKIVSSTSFRIIAQLDPTKLFLAYELQNELLRLIIIKTR